MVGVQLSRCIWPVYGAFSFASTVVGTCMVEYFYGNLHQEVIFMEGVSHLALGTSQLFLAEMDKGRFSVVLHHGNGTEERLPAATPAELLIAASDIEYTDYRREVQRLWDEHPLFEERLDIPVADLEDFVAEAFLLPSLLQDRDPVSFFLLGEFLHRCLHMRDDGSVSFLLRAGHQILRVLREPYRVQTYLNNVLEVTFDGMERASQQERFEKLQRIYPDVAQICDPALLNQVPEGQRVFAVRDLFGLYLLELALYFRQDKQRIARCDYCWRYFIPKTKKATRYCDRVTDGQSCKQRGANLARLDAAAQDEALLICKKLRDRMYARLLRWEDAPPTERDRLIPMSYEQYEVWSENARLARMEYIRGELSAEMFLRKIDTTHELKSYEAGKVELVEIETPWQRHVAHRWDFDPEISYPETIMVLDLTPGGKNEWELLTRDDLRRRDQVGHQSLREKYRKE